MDSSTGTTVGSVVRAGDRYRRKQGLDYTPGQTAQTVDAQTL